MQTRTRLRLLDAGMATLGLSFVASCFGVQWLWVVLIFVGLGLVALGSGAFQGRH